MLAETKFYCPHCGRMIDPDEKFLSNYARNRGWTPEIVARAASETGLNVFVDQVTCNNDPAKWIGLWRKDERDLEPFFKRAYELIALASDEAKEG